jgi:hypothetical protein
VPGAHEIRLQPAIKGWASTAKISYLAWIHGCLGGTDADHIESDCLEQNGFVSVTVTMSVVPGGKQDQSLWVIIGKNIYNAGVCVVVIICRPVAAKQVSIDIIGSQSI